MDMKQKKFTCYDLFVNLISLVTFLVDIGTDILVVVEFYERGHPVWGSLSVLFIALPAIVMQFFSLKWYHNDGNLNVWTFLPHLLLLGPLFRYFSVIRLGIKARQKSGDVLRHTTQVFSQQNDISILRLIEAFIESAPQLCLHLYIVVSTLHIDWLTGISLVSSLLSLSWALTAYSDALRLAYQVGYTRRWIGLLLHSLWHTFMAISRITALVLFASVFKAWIFLVAGTHWLVMTIIISVQGIDFGDGCIETSLFRLVAGFIHIFVFLNVKDGPTRRRIAAFYLFIFVESGALWVLWYLYTDMAEFAIISGSVVFGSFVLGLVFMLIYYGGCHPEGPRSLFRSEPTVYQPTFIRPRTLKEERKDMFNTSDSILDYNQSRHTMVDLSMHSPGHSGSGPDSGPVGSPFVHSANNTPCPRTATDRNLMAIWESSSQVTLNRSGSQVGSKLSSAQSKLSVASDQTHQRPKCKDNDYSIAYNEETDGLMFRIRSQKDVRGGDCSPYSVTNLSIINSKAISLSPLDAHKLWEESERRLSRPPISNSSSDSSIQRSLFHSAEHSVSSSQSSQFATERNLTMHEAPPPEDDIPIYSFNAHPVLIKPQEPFYDTQIHTANIQQGSVLKLQSSLENSRLYPKEKPYAVSEASLRSKKMQGRHGLKDGEFVGHVNNKQPDVVSQRSFLPSAPQELHYAESNILVPPKEPNLRKLVSFSRYLVESEPEYNRYKYGCSKYNDQSPESLSFGTPQVYPIVAEKKTSPQRTNSAAPPNYNGHTHPFSPSGQSITSPQPSITSFTSPRSTEESVRYINKSILSGSSCCSPAFPFIDESCSDTGSNSSSTRPPCNPKVCYMSALTQIADNEVAEVMQNSIDEQDLGSDVDPQNTFRGGDLDGFMNNRSKDEIQILISQAVQSRIGFNSSIDQNLTNTHQDADAIGSVEDCTADGQSLVSSTGSGLRSPPSYKEACQRSKVISFIKGTNQTSEASVPEGVTNQGFDPSCFPIASHTNKDAAWRLDYLNIEPSPNVILKAVQSPLQMQQEKYSSKRLNVSDPGSTPIKLQDFEDSPAKFGRNIDLFKKGDWNQLKQQKQRLNSCMSPPGNSTSRLPLSGNFQLEQLLNSPIHYQSPSKRRNAEPQREQPNGLSPPLKSSSQKTAVARKRSISKRESLNREFENCDMYVTAQSAGTKFFGIKRRADYVQYGKTAKQRQEKDSKTPYKTKTDGIYNKSFISIETSAPKKRQPFQSLENSPAFSSPNSNQLHKDTYPRFGVTPKKSNSFNIVADDDIINSKHPIRKWAPATLNNFTPESKTKPRRKISINKQRQSLSKTRSMEHLY